MDLDDFVFSEHKQFNRSTEKERLAGRQVQIKKFSEAIYRSSKKPGK